jgi:hypothetical protein
MTVEQTRLYMIAQARNSLHHAVELLRDANRSIPEATGDADREVLIKIHAQIVATIRTATKAFEDLNRVLP